MGRITLAQATKHKKDLKVLTGFYGTLAPSVLEDTDSLVKALNSQEGFEAIKVEGEMNKDFLEGKSGVLILPEGDIDRWPHTASFDQEDEDEWSTVIASNRGEDELEPCIIVTFKQN